MRKICIFLLILSLLTFNASAMDVQDSSVSNGCNTIDGAVPLLDNGDGIDNVEAAVLYEVNSDTLMYAYNADESAYPASLVKILTALIVIEQGVLSDAIAVEGDTISTVPSDAVSADLTAGEVMSVEDLLYCMMVGSANDAAVVLAEYAMGTQEAFVEEMNRYAQELGCTATNFTNVHGLHNDQQYSTARDICRILTHAIKNETFRKILGTVEYTVPATNNHEARELFTGNYLMNNYSVEIYFDSRVVGSRTGETTDRTRCVASVAESGELTLISVVMGCKSVYKEDGYTVKSFGGYRETSALLDMGFTGYKTAEILHENLPMQQLSVDNGEADVIIGPGSSAASVLPANTDSKSLIYRVNQIPNLSAPIEKGQKIAEVEVWCGTVCVAAADMVALNGVSTIHTLDSASQNSAATSGFGKAILIALGVVFSCIIFAFVCLCILRAVRIRKAKKRSRRHSRNRRRSW